MSQDKARLRQLTMAEARRLLNAWSKSGKSRHVSLTPEGADFFRQHCAGPSHASYSGISLTTTGPANMAQVGPLYARLANTIVLLRRERETKIIDGFRSLFNKADEEHELVDMI